jgi:hypothetical protein
VFSLNHPSIQSFLNLGMCKEYQIMSRSKPPKNEVAARETERETVPASAGATDAKSQSAETPAVAAPAPSQKSRSARSARRPEAVQTESRSNLVPINIEEEIRRTAYLLAEKRRFEPGHETEDWLVAESEVKRRYHLQSA